MRKIISSVVLLLTSFCALFAQGTISVKVQNLVSLDEQFNISFVIEGDSPSEFNWNPGDDFQLVWGPQRGSSSSIQIVNGKRTSSSQTSYTYVIMPKKTGSFTLPAATAIIKGQQVISKKATVDVVANGQEASSRPGSQSSAEKAVSSGTVSGEDLYLKLVLGKSNVIVGEAIPATLKLYQRVNIAGFEDAKFPSFNGFWSQEVLAPTNIEFHRENVGDLIYNVAVLRSWNLVAQQAGEIKIDPAELVCLVNIRNRGASTGSIFDSFFQDDYQTIRKRVSTNPVTVRVSGLPAGAPASFCGGVGKYNMNVSLMRDSLATHDASSLKISITGNGNTALLEAPKVNFPPDFEVYDVKVSDINGGKQFEYPFIPRSAGEFEIAPVRYSYFDIAGRKYVTLESKTLHIKVSKGQETVSDNTASLVQSTNRKDVKDLGRDIRFISKSLPSFAPLGSFFVLSSTFWIIVVLLVVLALAVYVLYRKVEADRADVAGSRNRGANKMARKRLSRTSTYLKDNLYTAFYEELHKTLLGYVSDKLTMDASDMSKENIKSRLVEAGVAESVSTEFISLLDACEYARYAPSAGNEAMQSHFDTAVKVISTIDGNMKKKNRFNGIAPALAVALMLSFSVNAAAQPCDSLWNAAVSSYSEGEWIAASEAWSAILNQGLESPELYYNLGNAEYKQGNVAKAILFYERALKLDPSDKNARFNLSHAKMQVKDKIDEIPEFFLKSVLQKSCWSMSSDTWAVLFLVFLAVSLGLVLVFLLASSVASRKTSFIAGIIGIVLAIACISFSLWQRSDYFKADDAIVMSPVCSVKSAPGNGDSQDLFILHEGSGVRVLDEVGEWRNIELSDGRQGWLKVFEIEII